MMEQKPPNGLIAAIAFELYMLIKINTAMSAIHYFYFLFFFNKGYILYKDSISNVPLNDVM